MPRAAVDTNVLIDYADGSGAVVDCIEILKEMQVLLFVPPSVLFELQDIAENDPDVAELAAEALRCLRLWGFEVIDLKPVDLGIVEQIGLNIRRKGYLPDEEVHDSHILAEAAFKQMDIFLTSDRHFLDAPQDRIRSLLRDAHVTETLIQSPRDICRSFRSQRR